MSIFVFRLLQRLLIIIIHVLLLLLLSSSALSSFSISNSPWHPSQNHTIFSPNSAFAAGFRRSPVSQNLFIFSVWFNFNNISDKTTSIIWSANLDSPVQASASLIITSNGDLKLINGSSGSNLWPTITPMNSNSTGLLLKNDGNLVFGSWESFHHPTNTFLPNQNLTNLVLNSINGKFSFTGLKNLVFNGSDSYWNSLNGFVSFGTDGRVITEGGDPIYSADFGKTRIRMLQLGDDGNLRILTYNRAKGIWVPVWQALLEVCQVHGLCGSGFICYSDGSTLSGYECICPPGYIRSHTSDSCVIRTPNTNPNESRFLRLDYVNYSGGSNQTNLKIYRFDDCLSKCLTNHKCVGFGFKYNGLGYCVLQIDNLLNGYWSPNTEMTFYLRVANTESAQSNFTGMSELLNTTCPTLIGLPRPPGGSYKTTWNIVIVSLIFTFEIASGVLLFWAFLKRYVKYRDMAQTLGLGLLPTSGPRRFTYAEIKSATKNFSDENVIGKGAYSDVYMGKLNDGRPVAVKCLKNISGGDSEFWGEVTIIARMHHLNLVRLWGFCNEKSQRILVYEHVPNGSLNKYLFQSHGHNVETDSLSRHEQIRPMLDWNIRYRIALGVARAIAYLHEECLEWVLHCDIKPENILLGDDYCPKVADFGLSKLRKEEQQVSMSKIRGTRGYMAPEWTKGNLVTSKVDVFSFGMVLLEIVTGVRNNTSQLSQGRQEFVPSEEWYFPKWAFEMGIEEKRMDEILDSQIKHCYDDKVHLPFIERMVKTAIWCIQERPEMRPSMGKVAKMLEGTVEILEPPKPTMYYI